MMVEQYHPLLQQEDTCSTEEWKKSKGLLSSPPSSLSSSSSSSSRKINNKREDFANKYKRKASSCSWDKMINNYLTYIPQKTIFRHYNENKNYKSHNLSITPMTKKDEDDVCINLLGIPNNNGRITYEKERRRNSVTGVRKRTIKRSTGFIIPSGSWRRKGGTEVNTKMEEDNSSSKTTVTETLTVSTTDDSKSQLEQESYYNDDSVSYIPSKYNKEDAKVTESQYVEELQQVDERKINKLKVAISESETEGFNESPQINPRDQGNNNKYSTPNDELVIYGASNVSLNKNTNNDTNKKMTNSSRDSIIISLQRIKKNNKIVHSADKSSRGLTFDKEVEEVSSRRVIILLLSPKKRMFEFIHISYIVGTNDDNNNNNKTSVSHVLMQLRNFTADATLKKQKYIGLLRINNDNNYYEGNDCRRRELINTFPMHNYNFSKDEVLVAIVKGYDGNSMIRMAKSIMKDKRMMRSVRMSSKVFVNKVKPPPSSAKPNKFNPESNNDDDDDDDDDSVSYIPPKYNIFKDEPSRKRIRIRKFRQILY